MTDVLIIICAVLLGLAYLIRVIWELKGVDPAANMFRSGICILFAVEIALYLITVWILKVLET